MISLKAERSDNEGVSTMRSYTAIWGIVIAGLLGMVALAGLAFWNSTSTMALLRQSVEKRLNVSVSRIRVTSNERGETVLVMTLSDQESKKAVPLDQVAEATLAFLYKENPKLQLAELQIVENDKTHKIGRLQLLSYTRGRMHEDTMILTLANEGYVNPAVRVTGLSSRGVSLLVSVDATEKHKASTLAAKYLLRKLTVQRYQKLFAIHAVEVQFRTKTEKISWTLTPSGQVFANSEKREKIESPPAETPKQPTKEPVKESADSVKEPETNTTKKKGAD